MTYNFITKMVSTLILTLLLMVGLFFFIRASVKDRIEKVTLITSATEDQTLEHLKNYFQNRSYQVISIDAEKNKVVFEGFVSPSWFMAILLSSLAVCGFFCLNLVLSYLYSPHNWFLLLILLSPLAGVFYWQKSARLEKLSLQLESKLNTETKDESIVTLIGHRDELIELQKTFPFEFSTQ